MRQRLAAMIQKETRFGELGRIIVKVNSVTDFPMIEALYRASQAGVKIDMIVRGMCSLRPGVPGVSDNIRVISIVGRFLEHARIFYFGHGGMDDEEAIYAGSADLMRRNLDRRVELLFPIQDPRLRTICVTAYCNCKFATTCMPGCCRATVHTHASCQPRMVQSLTRRRFTVRSTAPTSCVRFLHYAIQAESSGKVRSTYVRMFYDLLQLSTCPTVSESIIGGQPACWSCRSETLGAS